MKVNLRELFKNQKSPFQMYLESEAWKNKREQVLDRDYMCRICQNCRSFEVEHVSLRMDQRTGAEGVDDLIGICKTCQRELPERRAERDAFDRGA